ncbi:MAG TPA: VTT domain-containing protein [Marmoricola sp.]|nr:VTT domain-containing protein [Marmoricola sp.]
MHALLLGIDWMDPQWWLDHFGAQFFWITLVIVFVECGLLFPILPGDSLLFAVGLFIARGDVPYPLALALPALVIAAFAGNVSGYEIGRAVGPRLAEHDGRIVKRKYLDQTQAFFERYGAKALLLGRFVPIVRTFVTVVAGIGQMPRRTFYVWSFVGALLWVGSLTLAGYFLGGIALIRDNIEAVALLIVAVSVLPMVWEWWRHRRAARAL